MPNKISKTLILSEGGYKKYVKGSQATFDETVAITPMTASDTNIADSSVPILNSNHNLFGAWRAFDNDINYSFTASVSTGALVYKFATPTLIVKYGYSAVSATTSPKNFTLEGSNDGVVWEVLDTQINQKETSTDYSIREYKITNIKPYFQYKLNVSAINGGANLTIVNVDMWKGIEATPATPPSWKTVSPTLPTLPQFQSEGMEDLSVFDRKVQAVLESPMQMTSSVLGEGKVFKGTVNLKKYFDLRKLELK